MKKITTIFKIIGLIVVVLVMAQGCIPTTPAGGNPTPSVSLTGKIKTFNYKISGDINGELKYSFHYDTSGRVDSIHVVDATNTPVGQTITVARLTNKVIVTQGAYTETYFLHPTTNYIDSIYKPGTEGNIRTLITRDNSNNINSISEIYPAPTDDASYVLDSFVYVNNNIASFNRTTRGYSIRNEYRYNASLLSMDNTMGRLFILNSSVVTRGFDVEIYGISIGNNSKNLLAEKREIYDDPNVSFVPIIYDIYNPIQNILTGVSTWPLSYTTTLENNYY